MYAGQKLTASDGYQVALFPMTYINISQWNGSSTYSHCCGHPLDNGSGNNIYPVYAPFDMHLVLNTGTAAHTLFYSSDRPVHTPSGLTFVSIQVTHAADPPYLSRVKQGEIFYYTGRSGTYATGNHLHLDQSLEADATWYNSGIVCRAGNTCWTIRGSVNANEVFYLNDTDIWNDGGVTWQYYDGGSTPEPDVPPVPDPESGGNLKWWMFKYLFTRRNHEDL